MTIVYFKLETCKHKQNEANFGNPVDYFLLTPDFLLLSVSE